MSIDKERETGIYSLYEKIDISYFSIVKTDIFLTFLKITNILCVIKLISTYTSVPSLNCRKTKFDTKIIPTFGGSSINI